MERSTALLCLPRRPGLSRQNMGGCGASSSVKPLSGCIACKTCVSKHKYVFDNAVNEFLDIAGDYDGFVFGTPVHWGGASGSMTSFVDRALYADVCGSGERFLLKPAAAVISARRAGTTATWDQVNKYFALMQIPDTGTSSTGPHRSRSVKT